MNAWNATRIQKILTATVWKLLFSESNSMPKVFISPRMILCYSLYRLVILARLSLPKHILHMLVSFTLYNFGHFWLFDLNASCYSSWIFFWIEPCKKYALFRDDCACNVFSSNESTIWFEVRLLFQVTTLSYCIVAWAANFLTVSFCNWLRHLARFRKALELSMLSCSLLSQEAFVMHVIVSACFPSNRLFHVILSWATSLVQILIAV